MSVSTADLAAIRFGYGLGPRVGPSDAASILRGLMAPDEAAARFPMIGQAAASELELRYRQAQRALSQKEDGAEETMKALRREVALTGLDTVRMTVARCLDSDCRFRERLVMFWADHFTARSKSNVMNVHVQPYLNETIRSHVAGRFADMLKAVATSPLMMAYLDQSGSIGPNSPVGRNQGRGLNENLAREMLELHTLGVGGAYRQEDVRQLAELLTGLDYRADEGFAFRARLAEPGPETVLGKTYGGDPAKLEAVFAALDDLAVHPDTARHLGRKLAVHFVADDPPPALVEALGTAWRDSGGDLATVYAVLLSHPAAWGPELRKVKPPFDFLVSSLSALGVDGEQVVGLDRQHLTRFIRGPLDIMGQRPFAPPGPDGWPEEAEAWVTPQGVATRIRWSTEVPRRLVPELPDPRDFVGTALGTLATDRIVRAAAGAETRIQGIGLVLASPTFNRR